jgi:hypothetical protein
MLKPQCDGGAIAEFITTYHETLKFFPMILNILNLN